jgi:hypothetical protein
MLLCCWSPKGGAGTSTFAAALALVLASRGPARLADLSGDQPALFGLAADPEYGLGDWLAVGPGAPADALERLGVDVHRDLVLLPRGTADPRAASPESGAALGVLLRDDACTTVADVAHLDGPALVALADVADASVVVVRGCYLTLRRAVRSSQLGQTTGAVLVEEPGRALGAREVADVLGVPVLAAVSLRASIARVVDAGVLSTRLPEGLARPATRVLDRLGVVDRNGRAA